MGVAGLDIFLPSEASEKCSSPSEDSVFDSQASSDWTKWVSADLDHEHQDPRYLSSEAQDWQKKHHAGESYLARRQYFSVSHSTVEVIRNRRRTRQ